MIVWAITFVCYLVCIIAFDLHKRRVPNALLALAFSGHAIYLAMTAIDSFSVTSPFFASVSNGLASALISLIVFFPLWRFNAMGAGDVKFISLLGFCIGSVGLLSALLIGSVLAGVHALCAIFLYDWIGARAIWKRPPDTRRGIPYAAYIALGALFGMGWLMFHPDPWLSSL